MFGTISQALTQPDYIVCMCQGNVGKVNIKTQMHYAYGMLWHHFQQVDLLLKALGFCTLQRKGEQIAIKKKKKIPARAQDCAGFRPHPLLQYWGFGVLESAKVASRTGHRAYVERIFATIATLRLQYFVACLLTLLASSATPCEDSCSADMANTRADLHHDQA